MPWWFFFPDVTFHHLMWLFCIAAVTRGWCDSSPLMWLECGACTKQWISPVTNENIWRVWPNIWPFREPPVDLWAASFLSKPISPSKIGEFTRNVAGWWFGTFFIFPYIGNNHPNWLIFFRGVQTTNQVGFIEAPTIGMRDFPGDWREPRAGNRKHLEYSPNHYRVAPKPFQINCSHKARQFSLYQFIWRFP